MQRKKRTTSGITLPTSLERKRRRRRTGGYFTRKEKKTLAK